jgi:hypothetical protein
MRLGLATALVLIVLPTAAKRQSVGIDALSLHAGARARILAATTDSKYTLITVISASTDSLRYSLESSLDTKSLAWQQISKMDVTTGSHGHIARGAGIGFLVGLIGGAALGAAAGGSNLGAGAGAILGGLEVGTLGGLGGAVIGFA